MAHPADPLSCLLVWFLPAFGVHGHVRAFWTEVLPRRDTLLKSDDLSPHSKDVGAWNLELS